MTDELPSGNKGAFGGRGRWRTSNNCAERTPLEGRMPELGLHGCAGIANLGISQRLNCAMNFGRHWQGCLCREARDGFAPKLGYSAMRAIREGVFKSVQGGMLLSRPDDLRISTMNAQVFILNWDNDKHQLSTKAERRKERRFSRTAGCAC